ncbi:MAG: alpha/beta hydrolase, partial [Actinomycetota bacterium]|nr:alpha/beta hydrolase [Actinomycetota bacterium]
MGGIWRRLVLVALCALMAATGPALAQTGSTGTFEGLVDVGGYRLFLRCTGQGGPTVVLDAGVGFTADAWGGVQPSVAGFTRVCSYDRAGTGRSEFGPVPRTSRTMVGDLRTLLRNAGVPGPYVLVGHSLGGLNMNLYARLYPSEVAGVVLVDAMPANIIDRFAQVATPEQVHYAYPYPGEIPEGVDFRGSVAEVQTAPPFPNVPLLVLVRTDWTFWNPPGFPIDEFARIWNELSVADARMSPRGAVLFVDGASHMIHWDRPNVVIAAIRRVVNAARGLPTHTPGDFDGNGTTDIAVFRPGSGAWFVRNGVTVFWGTSGDVPVPGDYDGNGTTDIAVFRPGTGTWFLHGGAAVQWGASE